MKRNIILPIVIITAVLFSSCKKDNFTPLDMDSLNPDPLQENTALDQWLKTTFLDPYNTKVTYRYDRYNHESDRNVSPVKPEVVQPTMTTVIDGFINPYKDVAGVQFVKENFPKEWILWGSTSYDGSNVGYAGTASGGVRVNLFGLNNFSLTTGFVKGRLNVIHHEFTHILNQRFAMPADFVSITASSYNGNWSRTPADSAHKWGYVSSYASGSPVEDFAETTCNLLVNGQSWFDSWVNTTGSTAGSAALRAKEASVVTYFNSSLGINFRQLQQEVQYYLKNALKDNTITFPYWLFNRALYKTITIDPTDNLFTTYPLPASFLTSYNQFKTDMAAAYTAKYRLDYIQLRFDSPTAITVRAYFTATAGSQVNTQFAGDFSFSVAGNSTNGVTTFTKIAQASGTTFSNGSLFLTSFSNTIQKYLEQGTFVADWLPVNVSPDLYTKTGGFYLQSNQGIFLFGKLGQTL